MKKFKFQIIGIILGLCITTPMVYGNPMEIPTISQNTQSWEDVGPYYFYRDNGDICKGGYNVLLTNINGKIYVKLDAEWDNGMYYARRTAPADKGYRKFTHTFEHEGNKFYFNYYN